MADPKPEFDPQAEIAAIGAMGGDEVFAQRPQFVDDQNPGRPRMKPRDAVAEMLAEEKAKKHATMLTWNDRADYRTPLDREVALDRQEGRFDGRLPYVGPIFGYWWQNDRIFFGKVREVSIEQVPEKIILRKKVERKEPTVEETVFPRRDLLKAIEAQQSARVRLNPWTCRVCKRYTATGQLDYTAHFAKTHPNELAAFLQGLESLQPSEALPPPPPAAPASKKKPVIAPSA
jgi:hypothetical protein